MSAATKIEHYGWSLLKTTTVSIVNFKLNNGNGYPLRENLFYEQKHTSGITFFIFNGNRLSHSATRQKGVLVYELNPFKGWGFIPLIRFLPFSLCLQYILLQKHAN